MTTLPIFSAIASDSREAKFRIPNWVSGSTNGELGDPVRSGSSASSASRRRCRAVEVGVELDHLERGPTAPFPRTSGNAIEWSPPTLDEHGICVLANCRATSVVVLTYVLRSPGGTTTSPMSAIVTPEVLLAVVDADEPTHGFARVGRPSNGLPP